MTVPAPTDYATPEGPWQAEMTVTDWAKHRRELLARGYQERAPGKAASIDGPIARDGRCSDCGAALVYRPLSTVTVYRAFAVCQACNLASEF